MNKQILLTREEIDDLCRRIASEIKQALKDEEKIPVFVGVLKGSINFMMDLIKYVDMPIYTDYIQISSYQGTNSTGRIKLLKDLSFDCEGRSVVIIEDIIDTGNSMHFLLQHVKTHLPKKIYICTLFNKEHARVQDDVKADFVGMELKEDKYLIGYGLDYNELERNVPYVYMIDPKDAVELQDIIDKDSK